MLTKSNNIHLCRGWERQTQPTSTAASETQHELQPPLNLQLRTGQQASSPPSTHPVGKWQILHFCLCEYRQYLQHCLLSYETKLTSKVHLFPHPLSSPSSRRRYVAISISKWVLISSSILYSLFWPSMSARSCLSWASKLTTASCIWVSWYL